MRPLLLLAVLGGCPEPAKPPAETTPATTPAPATPPAPTTTTPPAPTTTTPSIPTAPVTRELALPADAALTLVQSGVALPLGDTNGDGVDDLVVQGENELWWAEGPFAGADLGAPFFTTGPGDDLAAWPAGDVTGDGNDDVWLWAEEGWYSAGLHPTDLYSGADRAVAGGLPMIAWKGASPGQIDGVGARDAALSEGGAVHVCQAPPPGATSTCVSLTGSSDAEFAGEAVAVGDLTGDGVDDVVVGARASYADEYYCSPRVYRFDGPIVASVPSIDDVPWPQWLAPGGCAIPFDPVIADFDGDGRNELAFGSEEIDAAPIVRVLDGDLAERATLVGNAVWTVGAGDVDGDGTPELLLGGLDEAWVVRGPLAGVMDLRTAAAIHVVFPPDPYGAATVRVLDRDADGDADLVVSGIGLGIWFVDGPL